MVHLVIAIVPFFGGSSSATHSREDTRLDYLKQTVESIREQLGCEPEVFQSTRDSVSVPGSTRLNVKPIWLPYAACRYAQEHTEADLYYYTEADMVLHVHDEGVLEIPDEGRYLAPWRLDLVGPNGECELPEGAQVEVGGRVYGVANGGHHLRPGADHWALLRMRAQQQAFSGAYLATGSFFKRIPFRRRHLLPVEHASGFDAKSVGDCIKTAWVERFWVDHLSPTERWSNSA